MPWLSVIPPAFAQVPTVSPSVSPVPSPSGSASPNLETSPVAPTPSLSPSPSNSPTPGVSNSPTPKAEAENNQPTQPKTSAKLVVFGSTLFVTNAWFNEAVNGDLFLNSVQWLAEKTDQPLTLRAKNPTDRRINLTSLQASVLGWLAWVIVPLLGLALALVTWWRQR